MADKWVVTGQRQTSMLAPGGGFQEVMEVSFRIPGTSLAGSIDVPMFEYEPDRVASLLDVRAAQMMAVQNL